MVLGRTGLIVQEWVFNQTQALNKYTAFVSLQWFANPFKPCVGKKLISNIKQVISFFFSIDSKQV